MPIIGLVVCILLVTSKKSQEQLKKNKLVSNALQTVVRTIKLAVAAYEAYCHWTLHKSLKKQANTS